MNTGNDWFNSCCNEAQKQLANGEVSWKDAPTNVLIMACFGKLTNDLKHDLLRPMWFFASSVSAGVLGYVIKTFLG